MLKNEKILVTGANGLVAFPIAAFLARDNEVWGAARFGDPESRRRVEAAGITTRSIDLSQGAGDLPADFTYVLHLAYFRGGNADFEPAFRVNAEGTGLLLAHCRRAKAALVMSSNVVYTPHDDPWHAHLEGDPVGGALAPWSPTSPASKVAEEAVARTCARLFELPTTIARLNTVYGLAAPLLPVAQADAIAAGKEVAVRWDPCPHTPIHADDINAQVEAMLDAASVPATIVNWGGDEQVTVQQWCGYAAEWAGTHPRLPVRPVPGTSRSNIADTAKRRAITGPCRAQFREAFRDIFLARHPEHRPKAAT